MPYNYALQFYRSDVVGGESSPNSVAPTHTVQAPGTGQETQSALLYCIDGTSLVVTPWFKDATSGVWLPLATITVLQGTPTLIDVPPAAFMSFQLGTNVGSATKFGVGFVAGSFEDVSLAARLGEGLKSTPITTSDTVVQGPMRELYVGTGGTVVGRLQNDVADRTFKNVPDGGRLPYAFILIKVATDAEDMLGIS